MATFAEVQRAALRRGYVLALKQVGPWYHIDLYQGVWAESTGSDHHYFYSVDDPTIQRPRLPSGAVLVKDVEGDKGRLVGDTEGWAQPDGVVHLETLQVRRYSGYWEGGAHRPQRWAGILLGLAAATWGFERSPWACTRGQLLAIRDTSGQHRSLVRYYEVLGFRVVKEVGGRAETIGDQLVWGGEGTLMEVDGAAFVRRWTPFLRDTGKQSIGG